MVHTNQDSISQGGNSKIQDDMELMTIPEDIMNEAWYPDLGATNHIYNNLQNLNLGNK